VRELVCGSHESTRTKSSVGYSVATVVGERIRWRVVLAVFMRGLRVTDRLRSQTAGGRGVCESVGQHRWMLGPKDGAS
jgi:hypothetical protein